MAGKPSFVIVGAGHCGGRAAERLRANGFEGRLVLVGAESELPYERPPLSKSVLTGDTTPVDARLHDEDFYRDNDIELIQGVTATALDPTARRVALAGGRGLDYDRLLLATGATPRRLPLPGGDLDGLFYLRDVTEFLRIRAALSPPGAGGARIVVVGGGFIGLEVAASARRLGAEVVVLEAADRLLGRALPAEAAEAVGALHRDQGVEIRLGARISGFAGNGTVGAVQMADGSRIAADAVVVGIGIRPETGLAEAAGIACDDGVLAGADCATEAPGVFVAGDAARALNTRYGRRLRLESWQNAEQQAEIAARGMLGLDAAWDSVPWVWSDLYDWNLQVAGFPAEGDAVVARGDPADGKGLFFALTDGRLVGAAALGRGLSAAKDLRIAQMLIERGARPDPAALADGGTNLKALLKAA